MRRQTISSAAVAKVFLARPQDDICLEEILAQTDVRDFTVKDIVRRFVEDEWIYPTSNGERYVATAKGLQPENLPRAAAYF